jgi:hypothetical protein
VGGGIPAFSLRRAPGEGGQRGGEWAGSRLAAFGATRYEERTFVPLAALLQDVEV